MPQSDSTTELQDFVTASKLKGASDESLATLLIRRGWPADDVYTALGNHWAAVTGLAVPHRRRSGESARDAFLYLLAFSTLGTWATALGSLVFELIHYWIPDAVSTVNTFDFRSNVTWQMASIGVAFPIYLIVMRAIYREAASQPERLVSGVRKWLTYIALWITAVTMVCDLICFLNYFLKGELTERFVLKALTVMIIAGAIFVYYIASLRWNRDTDVRSERSRNLAFAGAASIAVVTAFCLGLGVAGTPARQREIEADQKRVQDLRQIAWAMNVWQKQNGKLPAQLSDLRTRIQHLADPVTGRSYEYGRQSDTRFDLCADFATEQTSAGYGSPFWNHGKGRSCFTLDATQAVPF